MGYIEEQATRTAKDELVRRAELHRRAPAPARTEDAEPERRRALLVRALRPTRAA